MKKNHIFLVLILGLVAVYFLNQVRILRDRESITREELKMLRDAVNNPQGAALSGNNNRLPAIDATKVVSQLADILKDISNEENGEKLQEFFQTFGPQLKSAPFSKLKEIISLIEKDFSIGQEGSEAATFIWQGFVALTAKSNPSWAIAKLDEGIAASKAPIDNLLVALMDMPSRSGEPMSIPHAEALKKWLDTAEAEGRIEAENPLVAKLRAQIASAQGEQSPTAKRFESLSFLNQRQAAYEHFVQLQTPAEQRQAIEELSNVLHMQNFPEVTEQLALQVGFNAARELIDSASLKPEKYDLAAAGIAAAKIGPDTTAKANWFLESLRSEEPRAIVEFTERWTFGDYSAAAEWLKSLPQGAQRDHAISGFAPVVARVDGPSAVDWALTLTDPTLRSACMFQVELKWREYDSEAAASYLTGLGLPPE